MTDKEEFAIAEVLERNKVGQDVLATHDPMADPIYVARYELWRLAQEILKRIPGETESWDDNVKIALVFEKVIMLYRQTVTKFVESLEPLGQHHNVLQTLWDISSAKEFNKELEEELSKELIAIKPVVLPPHEVPVTTKSSQGSFLGAIRSSITSFSRKMRSFSAPDVMRDDSMTTTTTSTTSTSNVKESKKSSRAITRFNFLGARKHSPRDDPNELSPPVSPNSSSTETSISPRTDDGSSDSQELAKTPSPRPSSSSNGE